MSDSRQGGLAHDFLLPTLLFMAVGGMTWAVRGCSGFGAVAGCIFAGVMWGAAWWFISRDPGPVQTRRYSSAWIILALTIGIGLSGGRGWMQWPSFFEGKLLTDAAKNEWVPISPVYGFVWLFIAGLPWAGIGACMLAWCGPKSPTPIWGWALRFALGFGGALLGRYIYLHLPQFFIPLYKDLGPRYEVYLEMLRAGERPERGGPDYNLLRLINDSSSAFRHLGFYLGFLLYEAIRKDWKNVILILTVGILNGLGWALFQNWKWALSLWPGATFNFWRCWESSGGISIGVAYGVAYYLVNRRMSPSELSEQRAAFWRAGSPYEWAAIYPGVLALIGLFFFFTRGVDNWTYFYAGVAGAYGLIYALALLTSRSANTEADPVSGVLVPNFRRRMEWLGAYLGVVLVFTFLSRMLFGEWRDWIFATVIGFGVIYFLVYRWKFPRVAAEPDTAPLRDPNMERLGLYLGLLVGLGLSIRNGLKGWANIYLGQEDYWSDVLWTYIGPALLAFLVVLVLWILIRPLSRDYQRDVFPHAFGTMWLVLIVQNVIAQLVTGPGGPSLWVYNLFRLFWPELSVQPQATLASDWKEVVFSYYYLFLFLITAVIVYHYHFARKMLSTPTETEPAAPAQTTELTPA